MLYYNTLAHFCYSQKKRKRDIHMLHSPIILVRNLIYDLSVRIEFDKKRERNERDGYQTIEIIAHRSMRKLIAICLATTLL